jgi:RNA polymerase sigma-70 factor (ECF subfamily)
MERDEQALIRLSCEGDASAFRALLDLHYKTVYKMAYHLCGHREDAEDITQNACIKVSQNILSFKGEAKFTTWLYTIVLNTFRDWRDLRANAVAKTGLDERLPGNDNPERAAQVGEGLRQLSKLPEEERETLVLVFAQGFSHKEAADILGCAESTVSWRVHEARRKLGGMEEAI